MARLFLNSGETPATEYASEQIFGTNGNETVKVAAAGKVTFDNSFNRGGDVINILGNAGSYTASISGSNIVLTSAAGASIVIPVGTVGTTINFADAAGRVLKSSATGVTLGGQNIALTGTTSVEIGTNPDSVFALTGTTDNLLGTAGNDLFLARLTQTSLGSVANSLSSADIVNGGAGTDTLRAVLVPEFFGGNGNNQIDVQPYLRSVENIELEARDLALGTSGAPAFTVWSSYYGYSTSSQTIVFDAKDARDVVRIGSLNSDGDLVIENLNTLRSNGTARNTEEITITVDHTDNFNTDGDASDTIVKFDDDYLLAGQSRTTSQANYWLLDEDSSDYVGAPLANIERDGVTLTIDGTPVSIILPAAVANSAATDTWEGYAAALQVRINQLIASGTTILQGVTAVVDYNNPDQTYNDFGNLVTIPAISLIDAQGRVLVPTGFTTPEGATGGFDIYGRYNNQPSEAFDNPISVNIELHKVGRAGEGGDVIVGGKAGDKGIEVFHVTVLGAGDNDPDGKLSKPSNLGSLASTGGALAEVYITTGAEYAAGDTYASLTIRNGFGNAIGYSANTPYGLSPNDLRLVDADEFLGDLTLGSDYYRVVDLDTLTALGGGDVTFYGVLTGNETNQPYSYTTGAGDDIVDIELDGDALDYAQSEITVSTGAGNDYINISTEISNTQTVNQAILSNIEVNAGDGDDVIRVNVGTIGRAYLNGGAGNDVIYTDGHDRSDYATWVFNYDNLNPPTTSGGNQGVQTSTRFLGGATVTVALSGAGVGNKEDGGGVGSFDDADSVAAGGYINGYEARATISNLINGRTYFGDQRDINAAILKAINEDAVLSKLLVATIAENNTLVVTSLTSGEFDVDDLEITITPLTYTAGIATAVLTEARIVAGNSALTTDALWGDGIGGTAPVAGEAYIGGTGTGAAKIAPLGTDAAQTAWYAGLGVDNAYQTSDGDQSESETDNIINGGTGNDVIVLSTDSNDWGDTPPPFTVSSNNALLNGASNETIVLEDLFGNDTIVNFSTANLIQATGSASYSYDDLGDSGLDFLDFSDYLTSTHDLSVNTPPAGPDSNVSNELIPVTLEFNAFQVNANEVSVVTYNSTTGNTWAGLSNSVIANLFNGTSATTDYGNLLTSGFTANDEYTENTANGTDQLLGTAGSAKAVILVENGANLGEYKVFELSWNGNSSADSDGDLDGVVTATLVGSLDFGTSLTGLHEVNLVGSESYASLIDLGFGGSGFIF